MLKYLFSYLIDREKTTMVTGQNVWDAINTDPEFAEQPEAVREAARPFIEELPTLLQDLLDKPATLRNLMLAKSEFMHYCAQNNFITVTISAMPVESFGGVEISDVVEATEEIFSEILEQVSPFLAKMPDILARQGISEDDFMTGPRTGLSDKVRELYISGQLTIGMLLELQPMVIFKFKSS